jgi:hypothetical protein
MLMMLGSPPMWVMYPKGLVSVALVIGGNECLIVGWPSVMRSYP